MKLNKTNFADQAELIMKDLSQDRKNRLTTSKIRNMLTLINKVGEESKKRKGRLTNDELADIQYIKMRVAYDAGRDRDVATFVKKASILELLSEINDDREALDVFYKYFESLVAYHRFFGGND